MSFAVCHPVTVETGDVMVSPVDDTKKWRITDIDSEGLPSMEKVDAVLEDIEEVRPARSTATTRSSASVTIGRASCGSAPWSVTSPADIEALELRIAVLEAELAYAREVLVFADGLAVAETGRALSDLYAPDYRPAQDALAAAGCFARGKALRVSSTVLSFVEG